MRIEELAPDQKKISLVAKVASKEEEMDVSAEGKIHRTADFLIGDGKASILLSAWDGKINLIQVGKVYRFENAYTTIFRHSLRLNLGRYGRIRESAWKIEKVNYRNNMSEKELDESL